MFKHISMNKGTKKVSAHLFAIKNCQFFACVKVDNSKKIIIKNSSIEDQVDLY